MKVLKYIKQIWVILLVLSSISAFAQPSWTVNPNNFVYSMTITGQINIDGNLSADVNDMVAAFVDGECRGVVHLKKQEALNDYFAFLMIYSNEPAGTISFKIYDASADKEYEVNGSYEFVINGIAGSINNPYSFSAFTQIFEAKILTFSVPNQMTTASMVNNLISIVLPKGSSLNNLVASFELSPGATAYVGDVEQISGVTKNNFNAYVRYKVIAANPAVTRTYTVSISIEKNVIRNIILDGNSVKENTDSVLIGSLSSESSMDDKQITFSLSDSGNGNQHFYIDGNFLYNKMPLNFEESPTAMVKILADDGDGAVLEKSIEISVIDENDPPTDVTLSSSKVNDGTVVHELIAIISAVDEDTGDWHTFSLKAGNGINDEENAYFSIRGDSLLLAEDMKSIAKDSVNILIRVADSSGAAFEKGFTLKVSNFNNPPEFVSTPVTYAVQNQVYVYPVSLVDNEGDKINLTFNGLPGWLTFNQTTKLLSGIPNNDHVGDIQFEIIASDGSRESVQTIVISVLNINDPPEIKEYPGTQYFYTGLENLVNLSTDLIYDPDLGDSLVFQLSMENNSAVPDWLIFDPVSLSLSGTPPAAEQGIYSLKLTATDQGNLKEYLIFKLEVSSPTAIIDKMIHADFRVYPNPVHERLFIDIPDGNEDAVISIGNSSGQVIKSYELPPGLAKSIDMNGFESGFYLVHIRQGKSEQMLKIIKK